MWSAHHVLALSEPEAAADWATETRFAAARYSAGEWFAMRSHGSLPYPGDHRRRILWTREMFAKVSAALQVCAKPRALA